MSIIRGIELQDGTPADVVFDHIDGMYSYCYLANDRSAVLHIYSMTELTAEGDVWVIVPAPVAEHETKP